MKSGSSMVSHRHKHEAVPEQRRSQISRCTRFQSPQSVAVHPMLHSIPATQNKIFIGVEGCKVARCSFDRQAANLFYAELKPEVGCFGGFINKIQAEKYWRIFLHFANGRELFRTLVVVTSQQVFNIICTKYTFFGIETILCHNFFVPTHLLNLLQSLQFLNVTQGSIRR
jgi:hypothetical protein